MSDATAPPIFDPSHLQIEVFLRTVRDAVIVAHAGSGQIVLWNPAAEAMFGYAEAEALNMSEDGVKSFLRRVRSALRKCVQQRLGLPLTSEEGPLPETGGAT